jgi:3-oxoacyl-[acyl-carrier protein] reductase
MERNLESRVAVVTGAAEGIGFAIARRLARAGAQVALADINIAAAEQASRELRHDGLTTISVQVDVSDEGSVAGMVGAVSSQLGTIGILVNNAGIAGPAAEVQEYDIAAWDRVYAINIRGVFLCCRAVLPGMLAAGKGRIVNIASISGKEGNPRMSAYSSSKAAVIGFTKSLGKELATKNILVNAISPAVIQTRILEQLTPAAVNYMLERIPMGRPGQPDEVAALVHWLASDDCSFTTAQCIDISGGRATY